MNRKLLSSLISPLVFAATFAHQSQAADSSNVTDLYTDNCASCHGKNLEGGMAPSMLDDKWRVGGKDTEIAKTIAEGIEGTSMVAWKNTLSAEQIRTLALFITEKNYFAKQSAGIAQPSKNGASATFKTKHHSFSLKPVAKANNLIWSVYPLGSDSFLYTERAGTLWLHKNGERSKVKNTPKVWHQDQGGLLDVAAHPDYDNNGWIYLSYSRKTGKNADGRSTGTTVISRGKIKKGEWIDHEDLYLPPVEIHKNRGWHFGSRIAFADGYMFFSVGDEGYRDLAQSTETVNGKIHRLFDDGRVPSDNPFAKKKRAVSSIWTYGNRNSQGLTVHPKTKELWASEHGPRGGDEINLLKKGLNYGWPLASNGMNYNGSPLTANTSLPGMEDSKHYWTPSIAVSGIDFYYGKAFKEWQGNLLVASLSQQELRRLKIVDGEVVEDEILMKNQGRIRDVKVGKEGEIFIAMNDSSKKFYAVYELVKQ